MFRQFSCCLLRETSFLIVRRCFSFQLGSEFPFCGFRNNFFILRFIARRGFFAIVGFLCINLWFSNWYGFRVETTRKRLCTIISVSLIVREKNNKTTLSSFFFLHNDFDVSRTDYQGMNFRGFIPIACEEIAAVLNEVLFC